MLYAIPYGDEFLELESLRALARCEVYKSSEATSSSEESSRKFSQIVQLVVVEEDEYAERSER